MYSIKYYKINDLISLDLTKIRDGRGGLNWSITKDKKIKINLRGRSEWAPKRRKIGEVSVCLWGRRVRSFPRVFVLPPRLTSIKSGWLVELATLSTWHCHRVFVVGAYHRRVPIRSESIYKNGVASQKPLWYICWHNYYVCAIYEGPQVSRSLITVINTKKKKKSKSFLTLRDITDSFPQANFKNSWEYYK